MRFKTGDSVIHTTKGKSAKVISVGRDETNPLYVIRHSGSDWAVRESFLTPSKTHEDAQGNQNNSQVRGK